MSSWIANRFKIIKELSGGNMSNVYLCRDFDSDTDNDTCIIKLFNKIINDDSSTDDLSNKIFYREVESLERLDNNKIIKLIDKGYDQELSSFYICLEYFDSKTLDCYYNNSFSVEDKLGIIEQIVDAMQYSHKMNIIHRDLKPSNILVNANQEIKIIDFGISKLKTTFYQEYTLCNYNTPKYAAPEQKNGELADAQSDLYSLGVIMFELLIGEVVLSTDSILDKVNDSDLDSSLHTLLNAMLVSKREYRTSSMAEVKREIRKIISRNEKRLSYCMSITKNVIKKLYDFRYISKNDVFDAIRVINEDIDEETYINLVKKSDSYKVLGKRFEFTCVIDNRQSDAFAVVDVIFRSSVNHEANKEHGLEVQKKWAVKSYNENLKSNEVSVRDLLDELEIYNRHSDNLKRNEIERKRIIAKWGDVLKLQRKDLEDSKNTLRYSGYEIESGQNRIHVKLMDEFNEVSITDEQLLVMTSEHSIHRKKIVGYLSEIYDNTLVINLHKDADINSFASSGEISVDRHMIETSLKRQEKALKAVHFKETINSKLGDIIEDPSKADSSNNIIISDMKFKSKYIDESKKENIKNALASKDIFLLQGPPGTGKTTFISELVCQILSADFDSRILISSQSNVAVDHAMTKIKELLNDISMVRVGRKDKFSLGIENHTLEDYTLEWCQSVIKNSKKYLEDLKQRIGINSDIVDKYRLVLEVENLHEKVSSIESELVNIKNEKSLIEAEYTKVDNMLSEIKRITEKLDSKEYVTEDKGLTSLIQRFKEEYLLLGDKFLDGLDDFKELGTRKLELQRMEQGKINEINLISGDISSGFELLGLSENQDFQQIRFELEEKFQKKQQEYKKLSKVESICNEWFSRLGKSDDLIKAALDEVTIVGATCLGISSLANRNESQFDWVIVDEAGRATPPEILVPMSLGKKIVLVGDHKQLPPIIDKAIEDEHLEKLEMSKAELEVSLFEYLERRLPNLCKGILSDQYRMNPAIGDMISSIFYEDRLKSKTSIEEKNHNVEKWAGKGVVWLSTVLKQNNEEEIIGKTNYKTYRNSCEAKHIFETLIDIENEYNKKNVKKTVAIIAGYQAQKNLLRRTFESEFRDLFKHITVEINTVDAFQGRETDIVIYSIVRSNKHGNIGFLMDTRRLNVALSRARDLLIIVGNHHTVTKKRYIRDNVNPFLKVLEYINRNPAVCCIEEV